MKINQRLASPLLYLGGAILVTTVISSAIEGSAGFAIAAGLWACCAAVTEYGRRDVAVGLGLLGTALMDIDSICLGEGRTWMASLVLLNTGFVCDIRLATGLTFFYLFLTTVIHGTVDISLTSLSTMSCAATRTIHVNSAIRVFLIQLSALISTYLCIVSSKRRCAARTQDLENCIETVTTISGLVTDFDTRLAEQYLESDLCASPLEVKVAMLSIVNTMHKYEPFLTPLPGDHRADWVDVPPTTGAEVVASLAVVNMVSSMRLLTRGWDGFARQFSWVVGTVQDVARIRNGVHEVVGDKIMIGFNVINETKEHCKTAMEAAVDIVRLLGLNNPNNVATIAVVSGKCRAGLVGTESYKKLCIVGVAPTLLFALDRYLRRHGVTLGCDKSVFAEVFDSYEMHCITQSLAFTRKNFGEFVTSVWEVSLAAIEDTGLVPPGDPRDWRYDQKPRSKPSFLLAPRHGSPKNDSPLPSVESKASFTANLVDELEDVEEVEKVYFEF